MSINPNAHEIALITTKLTVGYWLSGPKQVLGPSG